MNRVIVSLLVALSLFVVLGAGHATTAASRPTEAAQSQAEQWLQLVDAGQFGESWEEMAPSFKDAVTKAKWKSMIHDIRKPLGSLVSRKLTSAEYSKDLPGAPEGEYVVLKYETVFEKKPAAVETVTTVLGEDLVWSVTGYSVK